jgi:hypothetical protein
MYILAVIGHTSRRTSGRRSRCPNRTPIRGPLARLNIHRRDRLSGVLHEYEHAA